MFLTFLDLKPLNFLKIFLIFFLSKISKLGDNCYKKGSTCEIIVEISHQWSKIYVLSTKSGGLDSATWEKFIWIRLRKILEHCFLTTFTVNIILFTWIYHLLFWFLRKKKLSSFTKPCNILSMFLNFEPL